MHAFFRPGDEQSARGTTGKHLGSVFTPFAALRRDKLDIGGSPRRLASAGPCGGSSKTLIIVIRMRFEKGLTELALQ